MKRMLSLILSTALIVIALVSCGGAEAGYEAFDEYIKTNGKADGEEYELLLGKTEEGGLTYTRVVERDAKRIELELIVTENGRELRSFELTIDKDSYDVYRWKYESAVSDGSMLGTINPEDYKRSATSLVYTTAGTSNEYEIESRASMAKTLCNYLLDSLEADLASAEITALELGFKDYKK